MRAPQRLASASRPRRRLQAGVRRLRFGLLQTIVLPLAVILFRLLLRTWRRRGPNTETLEAMMRAPRVVLVTYHGMFLQLLAFAHLPPAYGRRLVVLLSPSLDGRLLAAALAPFGIAHVFGTSGRQAIAGSRELIERLEAGDIGVVAADGPRGPCCIAKPGTLRLARVAGALPVLALTAATRGITFGSWDRSHLPLPFARVELALQLMPLAPAETDDDSPWVQATMLETARRMQSSVLPPGLRTPASHEDAEASR